MKEIVILSGKGGVGKSSITASLGYLLSKKYKVVMADTDVDAPNLDIVLGARLREYNDIKASGKAIIDYEKCTGCMRCVDACRFSSIIEAEKPIVISFSCEGCGACSIVCPEQAIEIKEITNGRINIFDVENMLIVSGELIIGESSSGHLVDVVKKTAKDKTEASNADLILVDGPPGIGCPVISSIKGCDYVIAVTEPTPSALSDMKRLIEVINYFKTSTGIVINKSDIHPESAQKIKDFASEKGFKILAEIPYDLSIPNAITQAVPVVKAYPESQSSTVIKCLSDKLIDLIQQ
ncbi:MAG TPA: (4Fe-4S)-binding protein [Nitrospiraceae bacterium]|nr:(4Fe-4S)-binding protein [Nitrospiraceae bacterium]